MVNVTEYTIFKFKAEEEFEENLPFKIYRSLGIISRVYHTHDFFQMWYVKNGSCIHNFNNKPYRLVKGDIFILPPGIPHALEVEDEKNELLIFDFRESFIGGDVKEEKSHLLDFEYIQPFIVSLEQVKPLVTLGGDIFRIIEALLEESLIEYTEKAPHYELFLKANLLKILAIISREYGKEITSEKKQLAKRYQTSILLALDFIKENYTKKLYLKEVCRLTMLSPAYFSYLFKYFTGMTFTEYIIFLRIENSKKSLSEGVKTITAIALENGFCDTAAFDRAFKKLIGMSPLKFRKL